METTVLHGVFLDIFGWGILLSGPSGIGKSDLALSLISQGHRLISDDAVEFYSKNDCLIGKCPAGSLQDFLYLTSVGLINIKQLFSETAIGLEQKLCLIIELCNSTENIHSHHHLQAHQKHKTILETNVPLVTIKIPSLGNLTKLVETIVRHYQLEQSQYNTVRDFTERQRQLLQNNLHEDNYH